MLSMLLNSSIFVVGSLAAISIALLGCATTSGPHAPVRSVVDSNRAAVQAAFDRWRSGAGNPFELLNDDAEWTIVGSSPLSKTYRTRQQFLDEVIAPFNRRVKGPLVPRVRGLYADGDTVIIHFDGETTANDGQPYRNTYTWYFTMQNSRVVRATAFFDTRLFDELWSRVPANDA